MARALSASLVFALPSLTTAYSLATGCACQCRSAAAPRAAALHMQMIPGQDKVIDSQDTYNVMMRTLLETNASIADQISKNYHLVDYAFLQKLEEEQDGAEGIILEGGVSKVEKLSEIKEAVNTEMRTRVETATVTFKDIVQSPSAIIMEGKIAGLARQGKIDDALMTLLEANIQQAEQAGEAGKGALQVMTKLKMRVRDELDTRHPPGVSLLRQLLRMDSKPARIALLKEKMSPKTVTNVILYDTADGGKEEEKDTKPDVDPREMAKAIEEIKLRFGNVDENYDTGFVTKLDVLATEAEEVALDLAGGKELSAKEQQDMMWEKNSISVWDLEQVEEQARQEGGVAYWEEEAQQQFAKDAEQRQAGLLRDMGQGQ